MARTAPGHRVEARPLAPPRPHHPHPARNKTVVAAWNGSIDHEYLAYATPDHPEYRRYSTRDFLAVTPEAIA
ncbi:MAG: BREX-3 system P-loop-containing protein BrxF [Anaerolineae bacterium]